MSPLYGDLSAILREDFTLFGCRGGESGEVAKRESDYMADTRARWPFLTYFDASTIKNDRQLATMVKERCSMSQEDAENDVRQWTEGKVL